MDLDVVWKIITGIVGGILTLLFAAWRLSRTWTRVETTVDESAKAIVRIEETVHGGPSKKNGLKESVAKICERTEQLNGRVGALERRLNTADRRKTPRPKRDRRKSA